MKTNTLAVKRILALVLSVAMMLTAAPATALTAYAQDSGACAHIHDESCGEDGTDCTHEHDEDCGGLPTTPKEPGENESGDAVTVLGFSTPAVTATVPLGTSYGDLPLPETVSATVDGETDTADVPVEWTDDDGYDGDTPGDYGFTGALGEGYILADRVNAPTFTVTVEADAATTTQIIVARFDALDEEVATQAYDPGEIASADELNLPATLTGSDTGGEALTIAGVTWKCTAIGSDPEAETVAFDPDTTDRYDFTAVLPEGYAPAEGVSLPVISVFIRGGVMTLAAGTPVTDFNGLKTAIEAFNEGSEDMIITVGGADGIAITAALPAIANNDHTLTITGGTLNRGANGIFLLEVGSGTGLVLKNITLDGKKGTHDTNTRPLVYISGGELTLEDGAVLQNNTTTSYGGGVYVGSGGSFTMEGGEISGNKANCGGGVCVNGGTFTMSGGKISGNEATAFGGGVYVYNSGSFTMSGDAVVSRNTANTYGGGVFVTEGSFTMEDGVISGNEAINGGGVDVGTNGNFTMKSGKISGNTASSANSTSGIGGGVYIGMGSFTMEDGEISGNEAGLNGGGVYVGTNGGSFTMEDGKISGNTATNNGGGVFIASASATFTMKGGLVFGRGATVNSVLNAGTWTPDDTGNGIVIRWSGAEGATYYPSDITDLHILPDSDAEAYWAASGGKSGIAYKNGTNEGFIPLNVTVIDDNADIATAKGLIESNAPTSVAQATVNTEAAAKTWLAAQLNGISGMGATGITIAETDITISGFSAAVAGTVGNTSGTNGSFSFVVNVKKGAGTPTDTTSKSVTITATAYVAPIKAVSVGAQNGTLTQGTAGSAIFTVTTTNIENGTYPITLTGAPTGVTSESSLIISGNSGTLALNTTAATPQGTHPLTITIDGTISNNFNLYVAASGAVPVSTITVKGAGGANTITTNGGTLQMSADILPANATNPAVTWSVTNGTGSASINSIGLLTATGDGTVTVTATAQDGSGVSGSLTIAISGQGGGHSHSYGSAWISNATNHWHECSCGDKTDIAAHTENSGVVTTHPTSTTTGTRTFSCTVCGRQLRTEVIPATGGGGNGGGGSSSSGGGSSYTPTTPVTTEKQPNMPTVAKVSVTGTIKDTVLTTNIITEKMAKDAIAAAGSNTNGIAVQFNVTGSGDYVSLTATFERKALEVLKTAGVKYVQIGSAIIDLSLDTKAITGILAQTTGNVTVSAVRQSKLSDAAKAYIGSRPVLDITIKDGKGVIVSDLKGGAATIGIAYKPTSTEKTGNLYGVYVDKNGKPTLLTNSSYDNGRLIFKRGSLSVYGVGYKAPAPAFTDTANHWAKDNIDFVASRDLISGTTAATFSPDTAITRADFLMALGKLSGANVSGYTTSSFTDIPNTNPAMPYIEWTVQKKIVQGIGNNQFGPGRLITREDMAVMMVNYAKATGYTLPVSKQYAAFADDAKISAYAKDAVKAIQQTGVINGKTGNLFDPKGNATRAEASTILRRFVELVIDEGTARGWVQNDAGQWQYINTNGKAVTGWLNTEANKYWFDDKGVMAAGKWVQISGKWYYFYSDGKLAANTTIDGYEVGAGGARK